MKFQDADNKKRRLLYKLSLSWQATTKAIKSRMEKEQLKLMELLCKTALSELLDEMNSQMPYRSEKHQGTYQIVMLSHLEHF
jgi:hypothetical protein